MTTPSAKSENDVESRARQSQGISNSAIYRMVERALHTRGIKGGVFVDVGCGAGNLWPHLRDSFDRIIGIDAIRYPGLPSYAEFHRFDFDRGRVDIEDGVGDVVAAIETIEHLENPRAFMRELGRLVRPGGWLLVSTPNQLSLLSLLSLVVKKRFVDFQDIHYPTHLTALLEVDLIRIARECGFENPEIDYSYTSRIPSLPWHYPRVVTRRFPRALSDNLLLIAQKPVG